jgi:hypothetical protein
MLAWEQGSRQSDQEHGRNQLGLSNDQIALFATGDAASLQQVQRQRHVERSAQQEDSQPVLARRVRSEPAP